jgi:ankyrin repeat protein
MPAHVAAINEENDIIKILVARCKEVLVKTTHRKKTLLHLAVIASCLSSIQFLINQGVDLDGKDVDGNTCMHLACKKRNHQVCIEISYFDILGYILQFN